MIISIKYDAAIIPDVPGWPYASRIIIINLKQNVRPMSPRSTDVPILRKERSIVGWLVAVNIAVPLRIFCEFSL